MQLLKHKAANSELKTKILKVRPIFGFPHAISMKISTTYLISYFRMISIIPECMLTLP